MINPMMKKSAPTPSHSWLHIAFLSALALTSAARGSAGAPNGTAEIVPGAEWLDTTGQRIQAHSAGILAKDGVFYWYGEDKTLGNFAKIGVSCYSSRNLTRWTREGVALPMTELPAHLQGEKGVCERPKVLFNRKTNKYVMWMHLDDRTYREAAAGIAVADTPVGPFKGLGTHANSRILYELHGKYTRFTATVGIDANKGGSVVFSVLADGKECFKSPVMTRQVPAMPVSVDITGVHQLELLVGDAGDGINSDHADWAEAMIQ